MLKRTAATGLALLLLLLGGCAHLHEQEAGLFTVTIAHVNDTHSHLESTDYTLKINGQPTVVRLGGFAALKSALDELRSGGPNLLFLHGGDMVQGTLYFSRYRGSADMYMLNILGLDATTIGNHEFDRGPSLLAALIESSNFPFVSADIDVSDEPFLAGKIAPYIIKSFGQERVGIIGVTTAETPFISSPGSNIRFSDPVMSVSNSVAMLHKEGVSRIILLSHLGYDEDIALAKKVKGIQVIVGGHTHSLLGDSAGLAMLGLRSEGPYPTVVKNPAGSDVLIVQAWEWAKALGVLRVTYNAEGKITAWTAAPRLIIGTLFRQHDKEVGKDSAEYREIVNTLKASGVAGIYNEDKAVASHIDIYKDPIEEMMTTAVAAAAEDLRRGNNAGPGPVVADAMLWKTKASGVQIAIQNTGGIRKNINAGKITIADIYELLPFNNTLVIFDIAGKDLAAALEEEVEYQISNGSKSPYLYVSGITFRLDEKSPKRKRVSNLQVRQADGGYTLLVNEQVYRIVVNSYIADGGDGMAILKKTALKKVDTGFIDAEVMIEYLKELGTVNKPKEKRISLLPIKFSTAETVPPELLWNELRRAA
jgi:5'-nucleotidase / UDP-sugar diphosphatase